MTATPIPSKPKGGTQRSNFCINTVGSDQCSFKSGYFIFPTGKGAFSFLSFLSYGCLFSVFSFGNGRGIGVDTSVDISVTASVTVV